MQKFAEKNAKSFIVAALTVLLALAAVPVLAQGNYGGGAAQDPAQQQYQQDVQSFDDQTLEKFAVTAVELGKIQNKFAQRLEGVQDQGQAMEVQREMNEEMVQAVEEEGLEVQTYNAIANQMNTNPEVRSKVEELIQELTN
jgi:hypothetical protein